MQNLLYSEFNTYDRFNAPNGPPHIPPYGPIDADFCHKMHMTEQRTEENRRPGRV